MGNSLPIATVIVTWNQTELTLDCLDSLRAVGVAENSIWLVDNGSRRGAAQQVLARSPAMHLVRLKTNIGFTGGCNAGARAALAASPDAIFFLNNDALVEPETIPALVAALADDMQIAAVGPKIYYHDTRRVFQTAGMRVAPDSGRIQMIGFGEPDRGQYEAE